MCIKNAPQSHKALVVFFTAILFFSLPVFAHAAVLSVEPGQGSYVVGSTVSVDVLLTTDKGESVNAVSGTLSFPHALVDLVSVKTNGSIVDLWTEHPSSAARSDTVSFEGLILNPGFTGTGKVVTLSFYFHGAGTADIAFVDGLVLANDGYGTNVLKEFSEARLLAHTRISDQDDATVRLPVEDSLDAIIGRIRPPVVTQYSRTAATIGDVFIQGITYPESEVVVWMRNDGKEPERFEVKSDAAGNFTYIHETEGFAALMRDMGTAGLFSLFEREYSFWLSVITDGVESEYTQPFTVAVGVFADLDSSPVLLVVSALVIAIGLLVLFFVYVNTLRNKKILREVERSSSLENRHRK